MATKTQTWNSVQNEVAELLDNSKIAKGTREALMALLETHLAPKSGGGSTANPPKLDEDGNIVEAWCRFHQRYEVVEDMVMTNDKSKGYCKASISVWNKANKAIKDAQAKVSDFLEDDKLSEAQELNNTIKAMKDALNSTDSFDYDTDWAAFNA